ncbi:EF-hand domain pair [Carpediemonas membranifera]|uniref:EF-hand domain pair n=1 Tax=Carpediemonas membranifera TaxID=201153 RepID=A0A8J6C041_9EUKA|nr:EF-hand domain pair [Carpediemonas membranifera]|eukprot:KAG9396186.1 EF-hand domain pair [Carpediemonas membranifera]
MKVTSALLNSLHLNKVYYLLTGRDLQMIRELFECLDIRQKRRIDDAQFMAFMKHSSDLNTKQIYSVFDMFDISNNGFLELDEFYLLICMLIAIKDKQEKEFLFRHSRTCFELLDEDGGETISRHEFMRFGFIFNFSKSTIKKIFNEYDISGDHELDYEEFKIFCLAAVDKEREKRGE